MSSPLIDPLAPICTRDGRDVLGLHQLDEPYLRRSFGEREVHICYLGWVWHHLGDGIVGIQWDEDGRAFGWGAPYDLINEPNFRQAFTEAA